MKDTLLEIEPVNEQLGVKRNILYGLQHVLTMYGGIFVPPLVIGSHAGLSPEKIGLLISISVLIGGLATILQSMGVRIGSYQIGSRLPLVQGVSFAGVATMTSILVQKGSIDFVFGAVLFSSILAYLCIPFFTKIIHLFPPIVTGSIITVIGLSLLPVAINWIIGKGDGSNVGWGSLQNIALAAATLFFIIFLNLFNSMTLRRLSILLSLVIVSIVAGLTGLWVWPDLSHATWLFIPYPFDFGVPRFDLPSVLTMFIVSIVILTETTTDIITVGELVQTKVDKERISSGLRADMLSSAIAPIFGSFTQSAFAQNVGFVAFTGIKSRFVVATGGVILVLLGLFPVLGIIIATMPTAILGGAGIILFGSVAVSGIRILASIDYNEQRNLIIVATSIFLGIIPILSANFYNNFPFWFQIMFHSGITTTCVVAVLLNLIFNHFGSFNIKRKK